MSSRIFSDTRLHNIVFSCFFIICYFFCSYVSAYLLVIFWYLEFFSKSKNTNIFFNNNSFLFTSSTFFIFYSFNLFRLFNFSSSCTLFPKKNYILSCIYTLIQIIFVLILLYYYNNCALYKATKEKVQNNNYFLKFFHLSFLPNFKYLSFTFLLFYAFLTSFICFFCFCSFFFLLIYSRFVSSSFFSLDYSHLNSECFFISNYFFFSLNAWFLSRQFFIKNYSNKFAPFYTISSLEKRSYFSSKVCLKEKLNSSFLYNNSLAIRKEESKAIKKKDEEEKGDNKGKSKISERQAYEIKKCEFLSGKENKNILKYVKKVYKEGELSVNEDYSLETVLKSRKSEILEKEDERKKKDLQDLSFTEIKSGDNKTLNIYNKDIKERNKKENTFLKDGESFKKNLEKEYEEKKRKLEEYESIRDERNILNLDDWSVAINKSPEEIKNLIIQTNVLKKLLNVQREDEEKMRKENKIKRQNDLCFDAFCKLIGLLQYEKAALIVERTLGRPIFVDEWIYILGLRDKAKSEDDGMNAGKGKNEERNEKARKAVKRSVKKNVLDKSESSASERTEETTRELGQENLIVKLQMENSTRNTALYKLFCKLEELRKTWVEIDFHAKKVIKSVSHTYSRMNEENSPFFMSAEELQQVSLENLRNVLRNLNREKIQTSKDLNKYIYLSSRSAIFKHITENKNIIKIPYEWNSLLNKARKFKKEKLLKENVKPQDEEIANFLNITYDKWLLVKDSDKINFMFSNSFLRNEEGTSPKSKLEDFIATEYDFESDFYEAVHGQHYFEENYEKFYTPSDCKKSASPTRHFPQKEVLKNHNSHGNLTYSACKEERAASNCINEAAESFATINYQLRDSELSETEAENLEGNCGTFNYNIGGDRSTVSSLQEEEEVVDHEKKEKVVNYETITMCIKHLLKAKLKKCLTEEEQKIIELRFCLNTPSLQDSMSISEISLKLNKSKKSVSQLCRLALSKLKNFEDTQKYLFDVATQKYVKEALQQNNSLHHPSFPQPRQEETKPQSLQQRKCTEIFENNYQTSQISLLLKYLMKKTESAKFLS